MSTADAGGSACRAQVVVHAGTGGSACRRRQKHDEPDGNVLSRERGCTLSGIGQVQATMNFC